MDELLMNDIFGNIEEEIIFKNNETNENSNSIGVQETYENEREILDYKNQEHIRPTERMLQLNQIIKIFISFFLDSEYDTDSSAVHGYDYTKLQVTSMFMLNNKTQNNHERASCYTQIYIKIRD